MKELASATVRLACVWCERKGKIRHVVGSAYKKGEKTLLEKFKYEISRDTTNGMTFYDIIEVFPIVDGVAKSIDESANYIKNKGFDDKYYKDLIVEYLKKYERAKKKDIRDLLWDKLPNAMNDTQKENKIRNLLSAMKKKEIIEPDSSNQQKSYWVLKK